MRPAKLGVEHAELVRSQLLASAEVKRQVAEQCIDSILQAAELMVSVFTEGGKVLLCGNGGSAADCQHFATELVSRLSKNLDRPGLPAIALTTDTSFLTAYSNDSGFEGVFERQVAALGRPGDLLIGISTSGSSVNVIRAVQAAKTADMSTISLCGSSGSLGGMCDVTVSVPSNHTQLIQESHIAVEHIICYLVERRMFGELRTQHGNKTGSSA